MTKSNIYVWYCSYLEKGRRRTTIEQNRLNIYGVPLHLKCSRSFRGHSGHLQVFGKLKLRNAPDSTIIMILFNHTFNFFLQDIPCISSHKCYFWVS